MLYICSKCQPGHHYTYRASTHVQQLSDNQQRRLEAETTHEREERLQQLSAAQVRLHMRERSVYSINQRRRLEAETTHEREERVQH